MTYYGETKIGNFKPPISERMKRKPKRERDGDDEAYLAKLRQLPCVVCGNPAPNTVHHLRRTGQSGMGLRSPDKFALPMCMEGFSGKTDCHGQVQRKSKYELEWFKRHGIDALALCYALWGSKHSVEAMQKVLMAHKEYQDD